VKDFPKYNITMNIQPSSECDYCGEKSWAFATVNTSKRIDLFTGSECKMWRASSICLKCNMLSYWHVDPDVPYEEVTQDER
jgi:hypothetical protein